MRRNALVFVVLALLLVLNCDSSIGNEGEAEPQAASAGLIGTAELFPTLVIANCPRKIDVRPPWSRICVRPNPNCPEEEVVWVVHPPLDEGGRVTIQRKEGEPQCFAGEPFVIEYPNNSIHSGPPMSACDGVEVKMWRYSVTVECLVNGEPQRVSLDPGIIFESN